MMGATHAVSGAAVGLGVTGLATTVGMQLGMMETLAVMVIAAGAALLPDLDHPQATISRALGPFSWAISVGVNKISGGHRQGTHSLLAIPTFAVIALAAGAHPIALAIFMGFLVSIASAALLVRIGSVPIIHTLACIVGGSGLVAVFGISTPSPLIIAIATAAGVAAHIAGDMLTKEGCPLLWPTPTRFGLPVLATGGIIERLVIGPLLIIVIIVLGIQQISPATFSSELRTLAERIVGTV